METPPHRIAAPPSGSGRSEGGALARAFFSPFAFAGDCAEIQQAEFSSSHHGHSFCLTCQSEDSGSWNKKDVLGKGMGGCTVGPGSVTSDVASRTRTSGAPGPRPLRMTWFI